MVLVDAGHEDELQHAEFRKFFDAGQQQMPALRIATILGVPRLFMSLGMLPPFLSKQLQQVPPEAQPMLRAGWVRTRYMTAIADEIAVFAETIEQVQATGSLGDLPLIVLTATGPVWWPDLPPDVDASQFRQMWLELQRDLTKLSTNSTQVFADKSSHFMQFDQPELIVDAIRQVIETTR